MLSLKLNFLRNFPYKLFSDIDENLHCMCVCESSSVHICVCRRTYMYMCPCTLVGVDRWVGQVDVDKVTL